MVGTSALAFVITLVASFTAVLYKPVATRLELFGVWRSFQGFENVHGEGLTFFDNTYGCEDLHYYEPTNLVFGVAEEKKASRSEWFPPLERFDDSKGLGQGFFFMVIPDEDKIIPLQFTDFSGPFITHGFDIWYSPDNKETIYFFAVNHLPNPAYKTLQNSPDVPKARSQVEVFQHTVGTLEVRHLRSIRDPLIRTPNDIYVVDATHFLVTNDHANREGLYRVLEDVGHEDFGALSDVIHVSITDLASKEPTKGFTASISLENIQNPNGFGHGRNKDEIVLARAASGIIHLAKVLPHGRLNLTDKLQVPTCVDNPYYFHDPYVVETGRDASGLVIAGLSNAAKFPDTPLNPSTVWLVSPPAKAAGGIHLEERKMQEWNKTAIFKDDGAKINSASVGVLVAIPPASNEGKKQAWLFVAGPIAEGIVKTKVDL